MRPRLRSLKRLTGSSETAFDLPELLAHLKLTDSVSDRADALRYVKAAIDAVERWTGQALLSSTWRASFDGFGRQLDLPVLPVTAVSAVKFVDLDGLTQTVSAADYVTCLEAEPAVVALRSGRSWPTADDRPGSVSVEFSAGYGADVTAIPRGLGLAVMALAAHWNMAREPVVIGTISAEVPLHVDRMLGPFKLPWVV